MGALTVQLSSLPRPGLSPLPGRIVAPAPAPAPVPPTATDAAVNPSRAPDGVWQVDHERARRDAQEVIDALDWTRRDLVIWVPATNTDGVDGAFAAAASDSWLGDGASVVALRYEASPQLKRSLPTGIETLRLVLQAVRRRGGRHRVLLAGQGQGAWVIGEALADPSLHAVVSRAVLLGHPALARHHYTDGRDPTILVTNNPGDPLAAPGPADPTRAVGQHARLGSDLLAALARHLPGIQLVLRDPQNYSGEMTRAVAFLRSGTTAGGPDAP